MPLKLSIFDRAESVKASALFRLGEFDQNFFPTPWDQTSWENLFLTGSQRLLLVLEEEFSDSNKIVGFILFDLSIADSFSHLLKIVADPSHRRKGFGMQLMSEAIEILKERGIKEVFLEVEEENTSAINLYKRFGFQKIHLKKHFYSNGANALIMTLRI